MSILWFNPYVYSTQQQEIPLYSFSNHTFTSAGAIGSNGPTLTQCQTAYSGQNWLSSYFSLYNNTRGYQQWTVPSTGKYFILAAGAAGANNSSRFGGMASVVCTTTTLNKSDNLIFIVGQCGQEGTTGQAGGGGGGTFVIKSTNTSYPLIAAGGGGGAGNQTTAAHGRIFAPGSAAVKSTDAYPALIKNVNAISIAGTSFAGSNAGAGYSQNVGAYPLARGFTGGFLGGIPTGGGSEGGFGGGGGGASNVGYNFVGGGGGGWCGGKVTATTGDGGYIGSNNFCSDTNSGHIWHNMYKNTNGSGDGLIRVYKFPNSNISTLDVTFTSCETFGATGPSYATMYNYYRTVGSNLILDYLVNYLDYGGMQLWLVPKTGTYTITATGGNGQTHTGGGVGGKGGVISANFDLTEGEPLLIVVGQCRSGTVTSTTGGAGGGASWVYRFFNGDIYFPLTNTPTPLIGAGGGGGAYSTFSGANVTVADTVGTASSTPGGLADGASFITGSGRSWGLFGNMNNAIAPRTTAYQYPYTNLDYTIGTFGGGGRSVVGNTATGGGSGWRAGASGAGVGAAAGTCWSLNTTYTYTGALNPRGDGNGQVRFQLL